jgi:hypothetical protein
MLISDIAVVNNQRWEFFTALTVLLINFTLHLIHLTLAGMHCIIPWRTILNATVQNDFFRWCFGWRNLLFALVLR